MKKFWMVLLVLLVIGIGTAGAQVWTTNAPANYQLRLASNSGNWQALIDAAWLFNGNKINAGEKYVLEVVFKSDRAVDELKFALVDNSEAAGWWKNLTNDWPAFKDIEANTDVTLKVELSADNGASGTARAANKLCIAAEGGSKVVNLTFSKFTLSRIQ
jgi:hypothetical protein